MVTLTLYLLGKFACFFVICWFFQNQLFKKFLHIRVSNSLDPDQARHFVESDLGPSLFAKDISGRHYPSLGKENEKILVRKNSHISFLWKIERFRFFKYASQTCQSQEGKKAYFE